MAGLKNLTLMKTPTADFAALAGIAARSEPTQHTAGRRHALRVIAAVGGGLALAPPLQAQRLDYVDTSGVEFPPELVLRGVRLARNGAGTRYRFVIRVYAAALYTTDAALTAEAALDTRTPKFLRVVMLRDIDATELGRLLTAGMQKNASRDELGRALPGMMRLGEVFAEKKRLLKGGSFSIEWVPGMGTLIAVDEVSIGAPIPEPQFFSALMKIWLGSTPADTSLKQALLNGPVRPTVDTF